MAKKRSLISSARRKIYEADAQLIAYWRRNPAIAARDLLGIELLDYQKWLLTEMFIASHIVLCCGRNVGKSFLIAVFFILWMLLFEDQELYIISSYGDQAKQTFEKMEQIVLGVGKTAASFQDLKDIAAKETVKSPTNKDGFSHNPTGYKVGVYGGSNAHTLNSKPSSIRSRRANVVAFDEAAFCDEELIVVGEAFAAQNTDFTTSIDTSYDPSLLPSKPPNKLIYASSQDTMTTLFYRYYKDFAKRMLAGDRNYFVCDLTCEVAMQTYMYGKPYQPLLEREVVSAAMASNKEKALREYYNMPQADQGSAGICSLSTIRRSEQFDLPALYWEPGYTYAVAFDPARVGDNSIIGVMRMYEDEQMGWVGDICHVKSLVDVNSESKYKLDSNRQVAELRKILDSFGGTTAVDYEYIEQVLVDAGAGGGGVSAYGDALLNDWTDSVGMTHHGLIDSTYDLYKGYSDIYPDAVDKLRMIEPRRWRNKMIEEFIDLMNMGCIRFPRENHGNTITISHGQDRDGEEILETRDLTEEEILSLQNIDLMKTEIVSIQKTQNAEHTTVQYAMTRDRSGHDDRFYVAILLAHCLYQKRKNAALDAHLSETDDDLAYAPICVASLNF